MGSLYHMSGDKRSSDWILCPSKTFPGKLYYFNLSTGETAWCLTDAEKKIRKDAIPKVSENHSHPEPCNAPTDILPKIISFTPPTYHPKIHSTHTFSQTAFPKPLPVKPDEQNVIWTPIHLQVPIVFAPDQTVEHTERRSFSDAQNDLGKDFRVQACDKPLCQRFINNEKTVIKFNRENKIQDGLHIEKFFTSTPVHKMEQRKDVQNFQAANQPSPSSGTLSISDLSDKAFKLKRLVKQNVYNIEIPTAVNKIHNQKLNHYAGNTKPESLVAPQTNQFMKILSYVDKQKSVQKPAEKFGFSQITDVTAPSTTNLEASTRTTAWRPSSIQTDIIPKPLIEPSNALSSTNSDNLRTFGDDLRALLLAKRKNADGNSNSDIVKKVRTTTQEISPAPKKKVTFQLDDTASTENDFEYEAQYNTDATVQSVKQLASVPAGARTDQWCLVADAATLLHQFHYLDTLLQSDPECRLLVPSAVVEEISAVSLSGIRDRDLVMRARNVIRRLPNLHILLKSSDDYTNSTTNISIIKCCLEAMDQNMLVIVVTNDAELLSLALSNSVQCFTVNEIKYGVAATKIQNGGARKEIQHGGSKQTEDAKLLGGEEMQITFENVPDESSNEEVNTFNRNVVDDLNIKEKEIIRKIKNDNKSNKIPISNDSVTLNERFPNNPGISSQTTYQDISTEYPVSRETNKILELGNNSNGFIECKVSNDKRNKEIGEWNAASDRIVNSIDGYIQSLNIQGTNARTNVMKNPELEKQYSDKTGSYHIQCDNNNTSSKKAPVVSFYFQKEPSPITVQEETNCGTKNKSISLFEMKKLNPMFELNQLKEPQMNKFKMGIDTSPYKIIDYNKAQNTPTPSKFKVPQCTPSNSNFKIGELTRSAPTVTSKLKIDERTNSTFKRIESTSEPHSRFKIGDRTNSLLKRNESTSEPHSKFKINESTKTKSNSIFEPIESPAEPRSKFKINESTKTRSDSIFKPIESPAKPRSKFKINESTKTRSYTIFKPIESPAEPHSKFKIDERTNSIFKRIESTSEPHSQFKIDERTNSIFKRIESTSEPHSKFKIDERTNSIFKRIESTSEPHSKFKIDERTNSIFKRIESTSEPHSRFKIDESTNSIFKPIESTSQPHSKLKNSEFQKTQIPNTSLKTDELTAPQLNSSFKIDLQLLLACGGNIDSERFTEKNLKIIKDRLKQRMDEWMCSFKQIMEELLTDILEGLFSSVPNCLDPPWTLYEALRCAKTCYGYHTTVSSLVDKICALMYDTDLDNVNLKKNINPDDFLKSFGCAIRLVHYLKNIIPNFEEIQEAHDRLNTLLTLIKESIRDVIEPTVTTLATDRLKDVDEQNSDKDPFEIDNKIYDNDHTKTYKTMNVIRTFGKNKNTLKLDNNIFIVSEDANAQHNDMTKNSLAANVTGHKINSAGYINRVNDNRMKEKFKINMNIGNTTNELKSKMNFGITKTIMNDYVRHENVDVNSKDVRAGNILTKTIEYRERDTKVGNATENIEVFKDHSTKNIAKGANIDVTNIKGTNITDAEDIVINNFNGDRKLLGIKITVPNNYTSVANRELYLDSEKYNNLDTEFGVANKVAKNNDKLMNNPNIVRNAHLIEEFENKIKHKDDSDELDYSLASIAVHEQTHSDRESNCQREFHYFEDNGRGKESSCHGESTGNRKESNCHEESTCNRKESNSHVKSTCQRKVSNSHEESTGNRKESNSRVESTCNRKESNSHEESTGNRKESESDHNRRELDDYREKMKELSRKMIQNSAVELIHLSTCTVSKNCDPDDSALSDGRHDDSKSDGRHGDSRNDDSNGDGRSDGRHGDSRNDYRNGNGRSEGRHGDSRSDGRHADSRNDDRNGVSRSDGRHGDSRSDGRLGDSKSDGRHGVSRNDDRNGDSRSDGRHADSRNDDRNGDSRSDGRHGDSRSDGRHGDSRSDGRHGDSKSDGRHGVSRNDDRYGDSRSDGRNGDGRHGDSRSDGGFEAPILSFVESFSSQLATYLDVIDKYLGGSAAEVRAGRVRAGARVRLRVKARAASALLARNVALLNRITHIKFKVKSVQNGDISTAMRNPKYTAVVALCLERAKMLHKTLNVLLAVTNEN